jgi:large subunit ribosomal protein L23
MELSNVLISPVITEKSSGAQVARKYTFFVHLQANKIEISKAVENAYGVQVESVNIIPVRKKVRVSGRTKHITRRHNARKAIVTLKPKQTLDFNKVKTAK